MSSPVEMVQHEIRVAGKTLYVPSVKVCGQTVVVKGNWLRIAAIKDEELVEGQLFDHPAAFVDQLRQSPLPADIFSFAQKLPEAAPRYGFDFYWDNWAALPITCYNGWWEKKLPRQTRTNIRRAAKCGVVVRRAEFDDELVGGIQAIYNETRIRQGKPFWHFGKDFDTVKRESATYLERSEFLGAYLNGELIGFIKIIYVDRIATIIHILSRADHQDKRPTNALLAKAVETCECKGMSFLVYGKYVYNDNKDSSLTEFKRRNGFEELRFPRYFCPLNAKGKVAISMGLARGLKEMFPAQVTSLVRSLRSEVYSRCDRWKHCAAAGVRWRNRGKAGVTQAAVQELSALRRTNLSYSDGIANAHGAAKAPTGSTAA
jgi:hypothetical protein